ncbi:MBL fold metallo-hydrolase [Xanthomonas euroxanthea]|uniref:Hydrolase n=1 Tax=Xanthomonas euroxanthea TaxID=2259622 RepID=A0AA46HAR0_9XANT|nr:MBL fold metallo-hydrolase [Xanthomonas euroxanthea]CAE1136304.1 MBL fold metallo-hydrolase [Xanthomonas euroxanthea]SUZ28361.1 hydrolase [Xanthomonas euroxanthea]
MNKWRIRKSKGSKGRTRLALLFAALLLSAVSCSSTIQSFGQLPSGIRLKAIKTSRNYAKDEFKNLESTSLWTGDASATDWLKDMLTGGPEGSRPSHPVPMLDVDFRSLDSNEDLIVWLGHSSYYLQVSGKRMLIDPVLSPHVSPFPFLYRAFDGSYPFTAQALPPIDYVLISHDHWDHLDYKTMSNLRSKVGTVVVPLGVGSHLERWGYLPSQIREGDWFDAIQMDPRITIHVLPARHFSGRGLKSNQTLWAGFLIDGTTRKVFYSGDGGYGPHFAEIGRRYGPVDVAIIENGQYDSLWAQIHMMPEESVRAAQDVRAKVVFPAHAGRFALASHRWFEPYERIQEAASSADITLLTPMIGETVRLDGTQTSFKRWWRQEMSIEDEIVE